MLKHRISGIIAMCVLLSLPLIADSKLQYPQTKKGDQKDTYFGTVVADPYRWLETDVRESQDVQNWVEQENKVTFGYLGSLPYREAIKKRLTDVWNYEKYLTPVKVGRRYLFEKNNGLQNQYVVYVEDSLAGPARVLLDPNTWSKDGTVALSDFSWSEDGKYVAYSIADAGSDWVTWHVIDVDTGTVLSDELKWSKFSNTAWTKDGKGFFYGRYPQPDSAAQFQSLNKNMKLYYHRVGTPQSADPLVYYRPDQAEWNYQSTVTDDGRYLVITVTKGTDAKYEVLVKDLNDPYAMPVYLIDNFENEYTILGNDGPVMYFKTDLNAPRRRIIAIDIRNPERANWREVIPQTDSLLDNASYVGGHLIGSYLKDAASLVKVFTPDGKFVRDVPLGTIGTANGFFGRQTDPETFYSFTSFTVPTSIYRYNVATGEKSLVFQPKVNFNPNDYEIKQVFYKSKDGTRVPMFLAYRKGLKLNGSNPTLLYGYGGFNISMTPGFSISRLVWMQMGGVYAVANLRGGGEYGEDWHHAGTKLQKQNVFDDFIGAAEWLIANKYTSSKKLAIQGGSNGGLLVGAAMTQRPELFAAALPAVGVMDMLRFQNFTAGRFWVDDYGSSADNAEQFKALYAYSPYHNIKPGKSYPATLVTTADHDDRVVPLHSFKFAAALQAAQAGPAPVLIRIETRAGHGAGKPITKTIEEVADQYAFLAANLGMKLPSSFAK